MFSLKSLLFIVAVAGLGAAGLIHRTQLWASAMIALTLAVLLLAACRAWLAPQGRTFWGPFALIGAVYLAIVSLQPLLELHYNLPTTQLVLYGMENVQTPVNVPTAGPAYGYYAAPATTAYGPAITPGTPPVVLPNPAYGSAGGYAPVYAVPTTGPVGSVMYNRETLFRMATTRISGDGFAAEARPFLWVAQCLWCLLLAFVMGLVCSWLFGISSATVNGKRNAGATPLGNAVNNSDSAKMQ